MERIELVVCIIWGFILVFCLSAVVVLSACRTPYTPLNYLD